MREGARKVTLKDIAEYTGLASNTVSRVINNRPYFSKEVEEKVKQAIDKLGYISNASASALKSGSTRTVAIAYDDMLNPFYSYMTSIMAKRFSQEGYDSVIFSNHGRSAFIDRDMLRKILARNPDAIVSFIEPATETKSLLAEYAVPFLVFGRDGSVSGFDSVCADEVEGGKLAGRHLGALGRSAYYYIGSERTVKVCTDRLEGYRAGLSEYGVTLPDENVFFRKEYASEALFDKLAVNPGAAVFCYSDMLAFETLRVLTEKGFRTPQDFAIVGYDNVQGMLGLPDFITTIDVDTHQMADVGAEVLLLKIRNDKYRNREFNKYHTPRLIRGQTT